MVCKAENAKRRLSRNPFKLACLSLVLLPLLAQTASARCFDSARLCIEPEAAGSGITELVGENRNIFPITLRLDVDARNMQRLPGPATRVIQPGERVTLARLQVSDAGQPQSYNYRYNWARGDYRAVHDDSQVYSLPFQPGFGAFVSQGYNGDYSHQGDSRYAVDFEVPEGTPIFAARAGVVVGVREDSTVGGPDKAYFDDANYVVIRHDDGTYGEYLHLEANGVTVEEGAHVGQGELIGFSGNTGFSGGPHLHFMVVAPSVDGGRRSFPTRFRTNSGIVAELRAGNVYQHAAGTASPDGEMLAETAGKAPPASGEPAVAAGGSSR